MNPGEERRADVVILTAIRLEFDAVRKVDAGAVPRSVWEEVSGPNGLPVVFRSFVVERGRPLRVAVAVAPDMGATAAVNTLLPLVKDLKPRCIAMCGVCAGRGDKGVSLGDVVAADRVYYHDTGKQRRHRVEQDLTTYKLRDDWRAALDGMDPVARFRNEVWFQARPLTTEWRLHRALVALYEGKPQPWQAVDPAPGGATEWPAIIRALRARRFLASSRRTLTKAGRRFVEDLLFRHQNELPALSPDSTLQRFRLHVAPIGSGMRVIEDERIWTFVSKTMRRTLGIEMEATAIGELAHRQRQHKLDWVVMKGVMDFANHGRDDHFKEFAARASAECLLWFLRDRVPTELTAGFDDLLTPGTLPLPDRVPAPSTLLNARYALVPWHEAGRSEILADLDAWADDTDPSRAVAVRLLHAEGGIGKTRLAIEWVQRRRGRYDAAGFLVPAPDSRWLERLCSLGSQVIIVIDYAESRADLEAVLQRVAAFAGATTGPRRQVRVLLLARSDGDWWKALLQKHLATAGLLERREPVKLLPLAATPAEREAVFAEASRAFATHRWRPPVSRSPIALDDVRFQRVLYLHMAALAAVEGLGAEALSGTTTSLPRRAFDISLLMDDILAHEERFWTREANDRSGATIDLPLARQLVAAATLRGGLVTKQEVRELCGRLEDRPRERADDALIALLHDIYDRGDPGGYLPGLEPDLLGEGLVLRIAAPPPGAGDPAGESWIQRVIVANDEARALTAAFIVLGRASVTNPAAVHPWIETLLQGKLSSRAVLALRAAKAVGRKTASSTLGDVLAEALDREGSVTIAVELAKEQIPGTTVSLRRVAAWLSQKELERAPTGDDEDSRAARAALTFKQGVRLSDLGQRGAALTAAREAVEIYRTLMARNPDAFQLGLVRSLNSLGIRFIELGQREAAIAATREALDIGRAFATRNPEVFQPDFAHSLNNLGGMLRALGQREAALVATREAVEIRRVLAARHAHAFQPHLAMSLNNLGGMLSELGQPEAALAATREAVDIRRALASRNPDAFQPDLATSLNNLGLDLGELGQYEPALDAAAEAVDLYRALASRNPDAFQHRLAMALTNLGSKLSALGQRTAALAAAREGVDLVRALAARDPDAFQPDLAMSLNNLGVMLSGLGQPEAALAATREAVDIKRTLAVRNPDAFQPDLATNLDNLGIRLSALGQPEAALAATREAVDIRRTLAARNPDAFQSDLATSLNSLGIRLSELGQRESALAATTGAVEIRRALAARNPDAFRPELAESLNQLGIRLRALAQHEPALAAAGAAVELYRIHAAHNPGTFQPDLAESLNNLGICLSELGQREPALAATCEAVDLYRMLATGYPDRFDPELAMSLNNLGDRLSELGQHKPALAATREAADLYRTLAVHRPAPFQRALFTSLKNLAIRLSELGEHELAQAATDEAAALRCAPELPTPRAS